MPSLYTFAEYSPEWPAAFEREAARIRAILGEEIVRVHHIGSTSVPGLAAKPIIDVLPLVRDIARIDGYTEAFRTAGYAAWGEYGLAGRRFFTKDEGAYRTHNVHIYQVDDPDADRHLAFPAYLRVHEDVRREYEALKREVYALHPADVGAYNDGKDAWIKRIQVIALEWYRRQGAGRALAATDDGSRHG
ncbi:MAG: GrpB family protein [Minicystis sp.]